MSFARQEGATAKMHWPVCALRRCDVAFVSRPQAYQLTPLEG